MSELAVRIRRRAAAFTGAEGAVTVDWVVITSVVVVTGISFVYYILGPEGGVFGVIDALSTELKEAAAALEGTAEAGAGAIPGNGAGDIEDGGAGGLAEGAPD